MSDQAILGVGLVIFALTAWATLVVGYYRFGKWYDEDQADAIEGHMDSNAAALADGHPEDVRDPLHVAHDHPEELAAARAAGRDADSP
jgi:hypothetical protein